jgi:integrase
MMDDLNGARDRAGRPVQPQQTSAFHAGRVPPNKGKRYPLDPPASDDLAKLMRATGPDPQGLRSAALISLLWRAGLRPIEALRVTSADLRLFDRKIIVGSREATINDDGCDRLRAWVHYRQSSLPDGPLLCVLRGPTAGIGWTQAAMRHDLNLLRDKAGVNARVTPFQLRQRHALDLLAAGVSPLDIGLQLGTNAANRTHRLHSYLIAATGAPVQRALSEDWENSSEHPNWEAGWHAGYNRGCAQRSSLERENARLRAQIRELEHHHAQT